MFFTNAVAEKIGLIGLPDPTARLPVDYYAAVVNAVRTTFGGSWRTDDANKRFGLEVKDGTFRWTEYQAAKEYAVDTTGTLVSTITRVVLERPNDDSALLFLGFADAALRAQILAAKPESSTLTLTRAGNVINAVWRGLLVTKKPNGSLDKIVQPSVGVPKNFVFQMQ